MATPVAALATPVAALVAPPEIVALPAFVTLPACTALPPSGPPSGLPLRIFSNSEGRIFRADGSKQAHRPASIATTPTSTIARAASSVEVMTTTSS